MEISTQMSTQKEKTCTQFKFFPHTFSTILSSTKMYLNNPKLDYFPSSKNMVAFAISPK